MFVFAGYVPATDLVRGVVELDDYGYVVTHGYLETSVPGVYAAGDLRAKTCGKWLLPPLMALLPRWSWNGTPSG